MSGMKIVTKDMVMWGSEVMKIVVCKVLPAGVVVPNTSYAS